MALDHMRKAAVYLRYGKSFSRRRALKLEYGDLGPSDELQKFEAEVIAGEYPTAKDLEISYAEARISMADHLAALLDRPWATEFFREQVRQAYDQADMPFGGVYDTNRR